MKEVLIQEYNNLKQLNIPFKEGSYTFSVNFVEGGFIEIFGEKNSPEFLVQFINQDNNETIYESTLTSGMWGKTAVKYFINFLVRVTNKTTNEIVYEHYYNAENKRVYIHLDSSAVGDTLAWFPYLEEFRKKHNCKLICSTFHNDWFESEYPEIEFIEPGTPAENLYAMYSIGWHYNEDDTFNSKYNPTDFKTCSLQKCGAEILGLDSNEIKPKLSFKNTGPIINEKYVCIAPHASAHAKYWNHPEGWQTIIDYLNNQGYKVMMVTGEPLGDDWHDSKLGGTLQNVINRTGNLPFEEVANDMINAEFFIGVSSGLSWLNWALEGKTILISGFSENYTEFEDCERISTPPNFCTGCFNKTKLDAGDWEWCPEHKNTDRHFECTKSITPNMVIKAIERVRNL